MNKPKNASGTPEGAWSTKKLVRMGMNVRNCFDDVVLLRQVHRFADEKAGLSESQQEKYKKDAARFLETTRGLADCSWKPADHAWLSQRNRSVLQQTAEGREQLREFENAPLLMDGRQDRVTGEVGAIRINQLKLEQLSARTGKPIAALCAYHDKPNTREGKAMSPEKMHPDDFRGMESEVLLCEGARVLLTQNLWVEAGLMNGALGVFRGYMWPEGGDPHSPLKSKRAPLCIFVEFDSVNLGTDARGVPRSFFPDEPPADVPGSKRNWVPIFRQRVASTAEEHVWREQYPLPLAWALTHWKAQGMTLERVRVHLSARTAAVPGIGFVAITRVKHPWDLVFEEDLPEFQHFMEARKKPAFRSRRRFELRQEARASRTLRRYGFCEADVWDADERESAAELLRGLQTIAGMQRHSPENHGRHIDVDAWLWPGREPDFAGELAREAVRLAGGDGVRLERLQRVAERLLDRRRARKATDAECAGAAELLQGVRDSVDDVSVRVTRAALDAQAIALAGEDGAKLALYQDLVARIGDRVERLGEWDRVCEEPLPFELQPLHMPAVREAIGALIPERLHWSLDAATAKGKEELGVVRGGSVLQMDDWKINVRSEDALAQGRLPEEVLEFFLLVVRRVSEALGLRLAIGSKTVGKEAGKAGDAEQFSCVMRGWRKVWQSSVVSENTELLLPVAVDEKAAPQDWVFVSVRSCVEGERLGGAKALASAGARCCVPRERCGASGQEPGSSSSGIGCARWRCRSAG